MRGQWDLLGDCDSVTGERNNFFRLICKDAYIGEAEVAKDLRSDAAFMLNHSLAGKIAIELAAHVIVDARERTRNRRGGIDGEAAAGVMEIDKYSAAFGGDGFERARDHFAAIASCR